MGLLDIFKKNKETQTTIPAQNQKEPFDINYTYRPDGSVQIVFTDNDSRRTFRQFYDVTSLIIQNNDIALAGHRVSDCYVAWYGSQDTEYFDPELAEASRKNTYTEVFAEIDKQQIQNPQYIATLMIGLLKKSRVEEYLSKGLQDEPDRPCGKYIGGIQMTSNGYGKVFNQNVGKAAHNTNEMRMERETYKRQEEQRKAAEIAAKRRQISELQGEIDELSK